MIDSLRPVKQNVHERMNTASHATRRNLRRRSPVRRRPIYRAPVPRDALRVLHAALLAHRQRTGEGPAALARRLGISRSNLANIEARLATGEAIAWDTAELLAEAIGYEVTIAPRRRKGSGQA